MTVRARIAVISAVAVAVVVVLTVIVAQAAIRRQLLAEIDESLIERATPIAQSGQYLRGRQLGTVEGSDSPRYLFGPAFPLFAPDLLLGRGVQGFDAVFLQFVGPGGVATAPVDQPVDLPVEEEDLAIASGLEPASIRTISTGDDRLRMITAPSAVGGIQMARSLQEFDSSMSRVTGTLVIVGGVGVALAALLGLVVARGALRPIDDLTDTVEHVAATGELEARIEIRREDEVGRLARSFNTMLAALETSQAQQHQLVRDASHELRTPLTALRTNIELLARGEGLTPSSRTELLEAATSELAELSDLVTELVELAADPDAGSEPTEVVDLDDLVERIVERFRRRVSRVIELTAAPGSVEGRPSALERAVGNLIDNADKWSPPGASITVVVGSGRVAVEDSGPGIDPEDRPRVFDRFYRSDAARTKPGSGLGLAIVEKVVDEHGGSVFVEESPTGGARVGFLLPTVS